MSMNPHLNSTADVFAVTRRVRAKLVWAVSLFVALSATAFFGQEPASLTTPGASQQSSQLSSNVSEDDNPIPAERIIEILQDHPDLLLEVKQTAARMLQERGYPIQESQITDERLFNRIRTDPQLQAVLSQELRKRGFGDPTESATKEAPVPQLSKRGSAVSPPKPAPRAPLLQKAEEPAVADVDDPNQPQVRRLQDQNPYPGLSSYDDLYAQIPIQSGPLRRFGAEAFKTAPGSNENLPVDLPVGGDYVLGPGDTLKITIWGSISREIGAAVDPAGQVSLPDAGTVMVAGSTLAEAQKLIQTALSRQLKSVNVDVSLSRLRTVRVYVVGDVEHPGAYDISSLSTALTALYQAGGPTVRGSLRTIRHYRGKKLVREIDLYDFLLRGIRSGVDRIDAGDTILVPPAGPQVAVAGMIRRPAIYELKSEANLKEVLDLAGGVLVSAALNQIRIERIDAHEKRAMLSVNLPGAKDKEALTKALEGFQMQDGDRVNIAPILPYNDTAVYLTGHVYRPGKYAYTKGMTIANLIQSYSDLLPEPADRAEIVRLERPDFHPMVIPFNLGDVLLGDDPIELKPFDTVRIYSRYKYDPPNVVIQGEVLKPGTYPLSDGLTAASLVRLAGGFRRSAYRENADLSSYEIQNGSKVRTESKVIPISEAMSGDPKADVLLKPGDVLTIRQLGGWSDIGASVKLTGEVVHPGTYGVTEGEKLSSLLERAGGFRDSAYPEGAVLEREQVKQLEDESRTVLIRRLESSQPNLAGLGPEGAPVADSFLRQQQQLVSRLKAQPSVGRLVIKMSRDISSWRNTPADLEVRAGDVLMIPKKPSFIVVDGAVNSASAITYTPGKNAGWYLARAGGPTEFANKKAIFVIRANGSVVGREGGALWSGSPLTAVLHPGDTVVVPEKIMSPSPFWRNLLNTAQIMSSLFVAAKVATSF